MPDTLLNRILAEGEALAAALEAGDLDGALRAAAARSALVARLPEPVRPAAPALARALAEQQDTLLTLLGANDRRLDAEAAALDAERDGLGRTRRAGAAYADAPPQPPRFHDQGG